MSIMGMMMAICGVFRCFATSVTCFARPRSGRSSKGRFLLIGSCKMTKDKEDQRAEIRFCVRLGMSRSDTHAHLSRVHGQTVLSKAQMNRWYSRFASDGTASLKDLPGSHGDRKLTAEKVRQVQGVVTQNRRSTCRQVAAQAGISNGAAHKCLRKKLGMRKRSATWVPHRLTAGQMQRRVDCSRASLQLMCRRGHPAHIVAGDESWFWVWQPESKMCTKEWHVPGDPPHQKVRQEQSTVKVMLILFFDKEGLVFRQWVPQGRGINARLYLTVMQNLKEAVRRHRPHVHCTWTLLHDNAPAHRADIVQDFLRDNNIEQIPHPPPIALTCPPVTTGFLRSLRR